MELVQLGYEYIKYLFSAKTKHSIHSPFVYDFVTKCLNNKVFPADQQLITRYKLYLMNERSFVNKTDYGTYKSKKQFVHEIASKSSISKKYGRLLYLMSEYFKPENMLELGTSLGISTLFQALGNKSGQLITIEGSSEIANFTERNFKQLGISNVNIITGKFEDQLNNAIKQLPKLNWVFFDGHHEKEATITYYEICKQYINNNTIFIFDDIRWSDGMLAAWKQIIRDKSITVSLDLFRLGIVFFRKEQKKEDFVIRY